MHHANDGREALGESTSEDGKYACQMLRETLSSTVGWNGKFRDKALENRFELSRRSATLRRMRYAFALTGPAYLAALAVDYFQLGMGSSLWPLVAMRCAVFCVAMACFLLAPRFAAHRDLSLLVTAYIFIVVLGESFELMAKYGYDLPQGMPTLTIMVILFYFFMTPSFLPTLVVSVSGCLLYLAVMAFVVETPAASIADVFLTFLVSNGFGIYFVQMFSRVQRREFLALEEERRLTDRLCEEVDRRSEVEDKLRVLATTDELTGIHNRRHFELLGEKELQRAKRYGGPVTVFMLDADHFKRVNDSHGHGVGDEVLKGLADIFGAALRDQDVLGRLGGEEFGVVLPHTGSEQARQVAERIRTTVADTDIPTKAGPLRITVSIGVAPSKDLTAETLSNLLRPADKAMYEAKKQGRNRVAIDQPG